MDQFLVSGMGRAVGMHVNIGRLTARELRFEYAIERSGGILS
jgi:hypothetical protein